MKVQQSSIFARTLKKLHSAEKKFLDKAIRKILKDPETGQVKKGDLSGVRVHKFKISSQQYLLAYFVDQRKGIVTLLALGTHENFYRDLKK